MDLTLGIHFEAVIPESYRTKVRLMSKSTFFGSTKVSKKIQKGPAAPRSIWWVKQKEERADLTWRMPGLRNAHLLYGPSWCKKEKSYGILGMPEFPESSFKCLVTSEVTRTQDAHQQMWNEIVVWLLSFSADPMTRKIQIFEKSGLDAVKWWNQERGNNHN